MENQIMMVGRYEARIWMYREQVVGGFIGIGRTLNDAKASGFIAHGEWESWVERVTGMSLRKAQRCMQAAREIGEDSALGKLDMSKAMLLLSSGLEQDERENIAKTAAEKHMTANEVKEAIRKARTEARAEANEEYIQKLGQVENRVRQEEQLKLQAAIGSAEMDMADLREQLAGMKDSSAEVERLRREVSELEQDLEDSERARREAVADANAARAMVAQGEMMEPEDEILTVHDVSAAAAQFITECGGVAYMELSGVDRHQLLCTVGMLRRWCDQVERAMEVIEA